MDVDHKLEELAVMIEGAKAVPLSSSCMVNRAAVLDLIEDIREALPSSLSDADQLLAEREALVAEGRVEALLEELAAVREEGELRRGIEVLGRGLEAWRESGRG